ncbi:MAG: hypothetical protein AB1898_20570 [Acidobacteriota bacterium]
MQFPVTGAVPLPRGAAKSTEKLQLLSPEGRFLPAQFSIASRWPEDGSIRWLHFDVATNVKAGGESYYTLREIAPIPEFPSPIGFIPRGAEFEVVTGPLRFIIGGHSNQLIDQVWVDENWGYDFNERTKILDSGSFDLLLHANGQLYRTSYWAANRIEIEESNALRAVIKVTGSFTLADGKRSGLDYIAHMTVYGGKTYLKLRLTLLNSSESAESAISPAEMALQFRLNLAPDRQRFMLGSGASERAGTFESDRHVALLMRAPDRFEISGALTGDLEAREEAAGHGWADLSDEWHGLAILMKPFRRGGTGAFELDDDSIFRVFPVAPSSPPLLLPSGSATTGEFLIHFHGKRQLASGSVKQVLRGFSHPVHVVADPAWYCRKTEGDRWLVETSAEAYGSEMQSLVQRFDEGMRASRDALVGSRHAGLGITDVSDDPAGSRWPEWLAGAPLTLFWHFMRTGDLTSFEMAQRQIADLKDELLPVLIVQPNVGVDQARTRQAEGELVPVASKPGPAVGRLLQASSVESLLAAYLLTGDTESRSLARLSLEQLLDPRSTTNMSRFSNLGLQFLALLSGYEVLGDRRYLERAGQVADLMHAVQNGDRALLSRQTPLLADKWNEAMKDCYQCLGAAPGILWGGLLRFQQFSGRSDLAASLHRSMDRFWNDFRALEAGGSKHSNSWEGPFRDPLTFAAVAQERNISEAWNEGLGAFRDLVASSGSIKSWDHFALSYRAGQQFLRYLAERSKGRSKEEVSLLFSR